MRHIITMLLVLICGAVTAAPASGKKDKERKFTLYGEVYDSFTKANVKALVTVMNQDSTVIDTTTCRVSDQWRYSYFDIKVPAVAQTYIIKTTADGYEDKYTDIVVKKVGRNNYLETDKILMKRKKDDDIYKDVDLEGVVVKGTRVQIAYRGDTIVYDAAAFKLPEGSTLDALIRQLPGAELKENGDIYINGKKIDLLTINGNDFLKDDSKAVLENLPYFTVKDLKVYYKDTKKNKMLGKEVEEKEYVMDVGLKREYSRSYLANAEAGMGTEDRWMAKTFGMYFDEHTRVTLYGNANNVNENRTPGSDGNWDPTKLQNGVSTVKQAGMGFSTENNEKTQSISGNVRFDWLDSEYESIRSRETFGSGGSIFSNSHTMGGSDNYNMNAYINYYNEKIKLQSYTSAYYSSNMSRSESKDSTFSDMSMTYRNENKNKSEGRSFNLNNSLGWGAKINEADYMWFTFSSQYTKSKPNENFSNSRTYYATTGSTDMRNRFSDSYSSSYRFSPSVDYIMQLPNNCLISPEIEYAQSYNSSHNNRFSLETLPEADYDLLGWLPSTFDEMMRAKDRNNSVTYNMLTRTYSGSLQFSKRTEKMSFSIRLPYEKNDERLSYARAKLDTVARRSWEKFSPSVRFLTRGETQTPVDLHYRMDKSAPNLTSMMPVSDDSNPLYVTISNPNLKNTTTHNWNASITFKNDSLDSSVNIGVNGHANYNSIGTRTTFNKVTGVYTYFQDNVDGNWTSRLYCSWQRPLDKEKRLRIDLWSAAELDHSVDFATTESMEESLLSHVDNINLQARMKLTYKLGDLSAGLIGKAVSKHTRGKLDIVRNMDVCDFQYGGNVTYTIPVLKVTVATDINMYSRRGYDSEMMNTNELVWNAQLTRSFFKGMLTAKAQAYDILQKLSSKQYSVNSQSRVETWVNNVPRYFMFSLAYKFTRKPNKS